MTMKATKKPSMAAAVHEAAHAVARADVGAPLRGIELLSDGGGTSFGPIGAWTCGFTGHLSAWARLRVLYAGAMAEARYSKRAVVEVFLMRAADDCQQAEPVTRWLVLNGYADDPGAVWRQSIREAGRLVSRRWPEVQRVALRLRETGRLHADELTAMIDAHKNSLHPL